MADTEAESTQALLRQLLASQNALLNVVQESKKEIGTLADRIRALESYNLEKKQTDARSPSADRAAVTGIVPEHQHLGGEGSSRSGSSRSGRFACRATSSSPDASSTLGSEAGEDAANAPNAEATVRACVSAYMRMLIE